MNNTYRTYLIQALLFLLTLMSTTLSGAFWTGYADLQPWTWDFFWSGLNYSIPFLGILTVHEFGHYLVARYYKVDTTLPYYIPFWLPMMESIGTLGAFIRMKSQIYSKKAMFDIGIAGPLAGFVAAVLIISYGLTHLPAPDHIYRIHPEYQAYGSEYEKEVYTYRHMRTMDSVFFEKKMSADSTAFASRAFEDKLENKVWQRQKFEPQEAYIEMSLGNNLLFWLLQKLWVADEDLMPNQFELFHYPFLFAGYLALFFTALNLLPVGQLDGGHVIYGLFGYTRHRQISITFFTLFLFLAGVGMFKDNLLGINFFTASPVEMLLFAGAYVYFLYSMYERVFMHEKMTAVLFAVSIFAGQFLMEYFFPQWQGFNGWMVFAYLVGRFLGLEHPPAAHEEPLDLKRKVLGWLALVIFVLCFTPEVFKVQYITP
jgi:membrane-associated protease RseP (regulator of RpoE activity)